MTGLGVGVRSGRTSVRRLEVARSHGHTDASEASVCTAVPSRAHTSAQSERPRFASPDAAMRFYFEVGPRLRTAKSRSVHSIEDYVGLICSGGKPVYEDLLALCADIGRCFDVLTEEERTVVEACFGRVYGEERGSSEEPEQPAAPTSLRWSSGKAKAKSKAKNGRPREALSFSGVARHLGWTRTIPAGPDAKPTRIPDHQRVGRVYAKARRKVAGRLRAKGLVSA